MQTHRNSLIVNGDITEEQAKEIVLAYDKTHWGNWFTMEDTITTDLSTTIEDGYTIIGHNCYWFMAKGGNGGLPYMVDKTTGRLYEAELLGGPRFHKLVK